MRGKLGIVGTGQVGAAAAFLLAPTAGVDERVLIDQDAARAASGASDIAHAAAFGAAAQVAAGNYEDLAGAQPVIIAAGHSLSPGQTRLDLLSASVKVVSSVFERLLKVVPDAVLRFATNPVDVMPALAVRRFGVPTGAAWQPGGSCLAGSAELRSGAVPGHDLHLRPVAPRPRAHAGLGFIGAGALGCHWWTGGVPARCAAGLDAAGGRHGRDSGSAPGGLAPAERRRS